MRAKIPQLREALEGRFSEHHALIVSEMLARIDHADGTIERVSERIEAVMAPFSEKVELLCTIPGVAQKTAEVIIAEIGDDMSRFPTSGHLASWAGMCPGNTESAGKHKTGKTRKGSKWLRKALVEAAHATSRSRDTYLAAQYARIRGHRGQKGSSRSRTHHPGHRLPPLANNQTYHELGSDYYQQLHARNQQAYTNRLVRQLEQFGHTVTLEPPWPRGGYFHLRSNSNQVPDPWDPGLEPPTRRSQHPGRHAPDLGLC